MKNFQFNDISILSTQSKRARVVHFHPHKNLIIGPNHTGKSTLIKTIFETLGATPKGKLSKWDANAISLLSFSIDKNKFTVLHQNGHRAMFSHDWQLIAAASDYKSWCIIFSKAVKFNLVLTDKSLNTVQADPKCFFLPFYINQDGSWQSAWDTFTGLQQFRNPVSAILDYFTGVKPPEYYEINSLKTKQEAELIELNKEKIFLNRARDRFSKSMSASGPKLDPENFDKDIDVLTNQVNALNKKQEELRNDLVRERELIATIKMQIELANNALLTYDKDAKFLRREPPTKLLCPTCGSEHAKSFIDVLTYAEDARVLRELVASLHRDEQSTISELNKTKASLTGLEENYKKISAVLELRRGDLKFGDVVSSMGAEDAFKAFEQEARIIQEEISSKHVLLADSLKRLKSLSNPVKSKKITENFRSSYERALLKLNLPEIDSRKVRLTSRPDLSGSGGPRSILAYYSALWAVCGGEYGSYITPLVIDAPQQQGQDDTNLPKIISFIANDISETAQVIVGIETQTDHKFDNVIHLEEPYHLLDTSSYERVNSKLGPLIDMMYDELRNRGSDGQRSLL